MKVDLLVKLASKWELGKTYTSKYLLGWTQTIWDIYRRKSFSLRICACFVCIKITESHIEKLGNRNDNAEENECDDKNAGDLFGMQFWKMPLYRDNWIEDFSMKLSSEEAAF